MGNANDSDDQRSVGQPSDDPRSSEQPEESNAPISPVETSGPTADGDVSSEDDSDDLMGNTVDMPAGDEGAAFEATVNFPADEVVDENDQTRDYIPPSESPDESSRPQSDAATPSQQSGSAVISGKFGSASGPSGMDSTPFKKKHELGDTTIYQPDQISRYTLSRIHGEGGLGQVWLAIDPHLNREVALKQIRSERESDLQAERRLIKEAQITGQLEHPNIIPVYELDENDRTSKAFYTMRFMRGDTLSDRIKAYHKRRREGKADPLELPRLLNNFISICNAMAYADSRGVVHRDLKPQNIMLGQFGEVIVLDWGLAKMVAQKEEDVEIRDIGVTEAANDTATIDGQIVGTLAYMAPEQAAGHRSKIDARTDIYGLGGILFMMLTGRAPHKGHKTGNSYRDTMDLLDRILQGDKPRPREIDPTIPKALEAICLNAMSTKRGERYQSATELADDVQRWLSDEPVTVYEEPWRERTRRWLRRHRAWAQSIAAALVIVTVGSIVATLLVDAARSRTAIALAKEEKALLQATTALDREQQAKAAEAAAKDEALRRMRDARLAVDRAIEGTSNVLKNYPGFLEIRKQLLLLAAKDYEKFAREKSDDPELQAESGKALVRLGDVYQTLNDIEKSVETLRSAESLFVGLVQQFPKNLDFQLELAISQNKLGVIFGLASKHADAAKAFDDACQAFQALVAKAPQESRFRDALARSLVSRSRSLQDTSQFVEAKQLLEEAIATFEAAVKQSADPKSLAALAATRTTLGTVRNKMGDGNAAVAIISEAIDDYDALVTGDPTHEFPEYFEGRAAATIELANSLAILGRDQDQSRALQSAIDDFTDLVKDRPGVPHFRENLAVARTNHAQVLNRLGRNDDAKVLALQAFQVFIDFRSAHPTFPRYRIEEAACNTILGTILNDRNENEDANTAFENAVAMFDDLSRFLPNEPRHRRNLGIAKRSLGRLRHKLNLRPDARAAYASALDDFKEDVRLTNGNPHARNELATCYEFIGDLELALEKTDAATANYRQALKLREQLMDEPEHLHRLAQLLANCPDETVRDPGRAIDVAQQLIKQARKNGRYWHALALSQFRAAEWDAALDSLDSARQHRPDENSFDLLLSAMIAWQKQDADQAKASYEKADNSEFMRQNQGKFTLRQFKQEAAKLIGIAKPTPSDAAQNPDDSSNPR